MVFSINDNKINSDKGPTNNNNDNSNNNNSKIWQLLLFILILIILLVCIYFFINTFIQYLSIKGIQDSDNTVGIEGEYDASKGSDNQQIISVDKDSTIRVINSYNPNDFKGHKSIIFFWASWCSNCKEETDVIKKVLSEYQNRGFKIYLISHDYEISALSEYMKSNDINYEVWFDGTRVIRKNLDPLADSVPLTYFLNEKGELIYSHTSNMDLPTLDSLIAKYMN